MWLGAGGGGFQVCGYVKCLGAGLSCVVCNAPHIRPFWVKVSRSGWVILERLTMADELQELNEFAVELDELNSFVMDGEIVSVESDDAELHVEESDLDSFDEDSVFFLD